MEEHCSEHGSCGVAMTVTAIEKKKAYACLHLRQSWYIGVEVSSLRDLTVEQLWWELSDEAVSRGI